jgi:hypothetical protein
MSAKIVGSDIKAEHISRLFYHQSRSRIGYRKYSCSRLNLLFTDILCESICHLLGKEYHLCLFAAFWLSNDSFAVINVKRREFQDFADSHTASGHEFKHQPVPQILGFENDFINDILFQDLELEIFSGPEKFSQYGIIARIVKLRIKRIFYEIEKSGEKRKTQFLVFCLAPSEILDMKSKISSDVIDDKSLSPKFFFEVVKDEFIVSQSIFFHIHPLVVVKMSDVLGVFHC